MQYLAQNIKYLRLRKRLSQSKLSFKTGIGASSISAYEKKRSTPKLETILKFTNFFNRGLDELILKDISAQDREKLQDTKGDKLRILPIVVDHQNEEMITLVPVKAAAGYLNGYSNTEFISELPNFKMPFAELAENKSYRAFQIEGESMLPIPSGAYIICEYVQDWELIRNGSCNVLVSSDEGIVYKRVQKDMDNNQFILHSDNTEYASFEVSLNEILEVWKALGYVCFELPNVTKQD